MGVVVRRPVAKKRRRMRLAVYLMHDLRKFDVSKVMLRWKCR